MAVRSISTRLAITGESEYQAKMRSVNNEIKVMASSLKLADSELKANGASIQALTAKGAALDEAYKTQAKAVQTFKDALENAKSAVDGYSKKNDELSQNLKQNEDALGALDSQTRESGEKWAKYAQQVETSQKKLDMLKKSSDDTSEEQEKLQKKIATANQAMEKLEVSTGGAAKTAGQLVIENQNLNQGLSTNAAAYQAAQTGVNNWQIKLNNANTELNKLDAEISENNRNLDEFKNGASEAGDGAEKMGDGTKKASESVSELNSVLASAGLIALLKQVAGLFIDCAQASIAYESAIAGVAKTTDLTDAELSAMRESLQNLSTTIPVTANELANITESAGQLGIAKQNLIAFTETMANLATATNMTSDAAATTLARFANITRMDQTNFDRLGSSIVALGNSFATTESEIADMALRLAGAGAQIKLSEGDILGIAAALSSLGIESQAGGSAFSKVMTQIQVAVETSSGKLNDFAAVANMSAQDFAKAFKEDAADAITQFIIGLGNAEEKGTSVTLLLEELGIKELRMSDALKRSANASELFARALQTSNEAWEENTALTQEAETRYATTESKMQMTANAATNLQTAFGDKLTPAIGLFADAGTDALNFLADLVTENEAVVPIVTAAATALGMFTTAVVVYKAAVDIAIPAVKTFIGAVSGNPVGIVLLALSGAAALIAGFAASINNDATPSVKELTEATQKYQDTVSKSETTYKNTEKSINGAISAAEPYIEHLQRIESGSIAAGAASDEYKLTLDRIRALLPEVNFEIDAQTGLLKDGAAAILAQADSWKKLALEQALRNKYDEQIKAEADAAVEYKMNLADLEIAQRKGLELEDEIGKAREKWSSVWERQQAILKDENLTYEEQQKAVSELTAEKERLAEQIKTLDGEVQSNKKTQETYTQAVDDQKVIIDENSKAVETAQAAIEKYADEQEKATKETENSADGLETATRTIEDYAAAWGVSVEEIQKYLDKGKGSLEDWEAEQIEATNEIAEKWGVIPESVQAALSNTHMTLDQFDEAMQDYKDAVIEKVDGVVNGFKKIPMEFDMSAQTMLENLIANKETYAAWEKSMAEITRLLGPTAAEEFGKLGPAATAAMQEIANSPELLEEYRAAFGVKVDETTKEVIEKWNDPNFIGAPNAALSAAAAQTRDNSDIVEAIGGIAKDSFDGYKENTNAETYGEATEDAMSGAVDAVTDKTPELKTAVDTAGKAVETSLKTSATQSVISFSSEFAKITGRTNTTLANLRSTVTNGTSSLPSTMYGVGAGIVNGMINGMYGRSGALNSTITAIVNGAVISARKAAQINSPSRKTMPIGDGMVEGMIVSADAKKAKLKATMQGIVDASVKLDTTDAVRTLQNMAVSAPVVSGVSNGTAAPVTPSVNVNVNISEFNNNTPQDGEALIQQISTGLYQELRRTQLGVGQR